MNYAAYVWALTRCGESPHMPSMVSEREIIVGLRARLAETERDISVLQERAVKYRDAIAAMEAVLGLLEDQGSNQSDTQTKLGPPRPSGAPTNFEMARLVLLSAQKEGKAGLTAAELVDEIGRRYWPGVQAPQIMPTMYQLAKNGRLIKGDDGVFRFPETNETGEGESHDRASSGGSNPA
ncbi:hypothetical protein Rvan_3279 [Rhodomicrobium vannielii ATCC 17100]|uniref:Uncharacterized protein n=2 Tax=Rhodomicrobium vannielii TaxID=1069 RepID=E3I285_RHOVT|nr:hypothetical protein Rvan_3279 [Rhodomicrobium vannielii ATCC 17100]